MSFVLKRMLAVKLHDEAKQELREVAAYYRAKSPRLERAFLSEFQQACNDLRRFPLSRPRGTAGTRKSVLRSFPYNIIYLLQPMRIVIIAVAHQKRRPGYWLERADFR